PEAPDGAREHQRAFAVAAVACTGERRAHVVVLECEPVVPLPLARTGELRLRLEDEVEKEGEVAIWESLQFLALLEQVARELPDRFQHEEPSFAHRLEEVPIHKGSDLVELGSGDRLGRLEREASSEDRQPSQEFLRRSLEQPIAPFDRRAERLVSL